jgi:hypothetical protein
MSGRSQPPSRPFALRREPDAVGLQMTRIARAPSRLGAGSDDPGSRGPLPGGRRLEPPAEGDETHRTTVDSAIARPVCSDKSGSRAPCADQCFFGVGFVALTVHLQVVVAESEYVP